MFADCGASAAVRYLRVSASRFSGQYTSERGFRRYGSRSTQRRPRASLFAANNASTVSDYSPTSIGSRASSPLTCAVLLRGWRRLPISVVPPVVEEALCISMRRVLGHCPSSLCSAAHPRVALFLRWQVPLIRRSSFRAKAQTLVRYVRRTRRRPLSPAYSLLVVLRTTLRCMCALCPTGARSRFWL